MDDNEKKATTKKHDSRQEANELHKHHMVALTASFIVLAVIIGVAIVYLSR